MRSCCFKCINKYLIIIRLAPSRRLSAKAMFDKVLFLACGHLVYNGTSARFWCLEWVEFSYGDDTPYLVHVCVEESLFLTCRRLYEGANYIISRFIISHHIVWFAFVMTDRTSCLHDFFKKNVHTRPGWCLSTRHCTKVSVQHLLLTPWNSKKSVVITIGIPIVFRPGDITHPWPYFVLSIAKLQQNYIHRTLTSTKHQAPSSIAVPASLNRC